MRNLQNIFDKMIQGHMPYYLIEAVERRIEELGITLTTEQKQTLKDMAKRGEVNNITLSLNEDQIPDHVVVSREADGQPILDLGDMSSVFEDSIEKFADRIESIIPKLASRFGAKVAQSLKRDANEMLNERRKIARDYESRIADVWSPALDLLETMIVIASEYGEDLNDELRNNMPVGKENTIDAVTRLFARAIQVSREILVLLRSGYADGALARWRCLYEIVVILFFITENGEDTAERYLNHETIESHRAMELFQAHCQALGETPLDANESPLKKSFSY